jgi:XTP/dITP diphosphohydrolase
VPNASSSSKPRLVVATLNRAKGRELLDLLGNVPYELLLLADVPGATLPEETGKMYAENALIKARAGVLATGVIALADDSGIEVDALDGGPGLYSARFGGHGLNDAGRTALLLERLRGMPTERRTARFRSVIAIVEPGGREQLVEGVVEGRIAQAPRGAGGFGYDPIFFYPPYGCTLAEVGADRKLAVAHRGQAFRQFRAWLTGLTD